MPQTDPFATLQETTRRHQADHRCGAYTYAEGSLLGVIAATAQAHRIVEIGTALGYTAAWLAYGAPNSHVDTIESDPIHVDLARQALDHEGLGNRITVHHGDAEDVLATLASGAGTYDVAFFDGFTPTGATIRGLRSLLKPGGVLVAANLTLGPSGDVLRDLRDPSRWLTHELGETALCVKAGDA